MHFVSLIGDRDMQILEFVCFFVVFFNGVTFCTPLFLFLPTTECALDFYDLFEFFVVFDKFFTFANDLFLNWWIGKTNFGITRDAIVRFFAGLPSHAREARERSTTSFPLTGASIAVNKLSNVRSQVWWCTWMLWIVMIWASYPLIFFRKRRTVTFWCHICRNDRNRYPWRSLQ